MTRISFFLRLLKLFLLVNVIHCQEDGPSLVLLPKGVVLKSLSDSVYVQCTAKVENGDLISEMEWRGPGDREIPNKDATGRRSSMLGFENNQLDLYIKNLRAEDVGHYNCTALYAGNHRLMESVEIISFKDIDFKDTETVQTPVRGTDAKIRCVVSSDPAPLVDWLKDGTKFSGDAEHIIQTDGILIKNISINDEGVYRCRVRVAELGKIAFKDIQVEVHELPVITLAPIDSDGVEKESVSFECVAKGKPPPHYSWVNNENELLNDKEGYFVDEIRGELRIMDLRPDHSGTYRCTASNAAGDITAEAHLRVLTRPKLEHYENVTIGLNDDAVFRCTFSGDPFPNVVFKKETNEESFVDNVNEDLRIDVQQSKDNRGFRVGTMKIESVMRKDDGLYSCSGVSSGGETVVWGHITVEFPPSFEDQPQDEFWSWEQQPVNLSCLATSIPNATVQWYIRNDPVRLEDPNYKIISPGPNGVLQVTPLDGSYFDTYTCQATNTIGVVEHDVSLKQVQKPGPVSSTNAEKKTATTIQWTIRDPLKDGGRPVLGYTVRFRLESQSWDKSETKYWPKGSTYIIDHLVPKNSYMFMFAAKNDVGDGEWSGEKNEVMPKEAEPEEPLIYSIDPKVVKGIPYSDHYDLQWQVPLDNGEDIDHFLITYYKVTNTTKGGEFKIKGSQEDVTVPHPGKSTYKLDDLASNTIYKIELRAHNKLGNSRPAVAMIKTSPDPSGSTAPKTKETAGGSSGKVVGIIIVVLIIVLVVIDAIAYFAKDVGVTATVIKKCSKAGKTEKDKEAMLEAVTASSVKSDAGNNGKAKEPQTETKAEKEPEKEVEKEPTESTPMIEGGDSDKEAIQKEEKEEKAAVDNPLAKSESQDCVTKDSAV